MHDEFDFRDDDELFSMTADDSIDHPILTWIFGIAIITYLIWFIFVSPFMENSKSRRIRYIPSQWETVIHVETNEPPERIYIPGHWETENINIHD